MATLEKKNMRFCKGMMAVHHRARSSCGRKASPPVAKKKLCLSSCQKKGHRKGPPLLLLHKILWWLHYNQGTLMQHFFQALFLDTEKRSNASFLGKNQIFTQKSPHKPIQPALKCQSTKIKPVGWDCFLPYQCDNSHRRSVCQGSI